MMEAPLKWCPTKPYCVRWGHNVHFKESCVRCRQARTAFMTKYGKDSLFSALDELYPSQPQAKERPHMSVKRVILGFTDVFRFVLFATLMVLVIAGWVYMTVQAVKAIL